MGEKQQSAADVANGRDELQAYYDQGYHRAVHFEMIKDEDYYWARSKAFSRLYFSRKDRSLAVLDYGCGLGQTIASLPNAHGYDASREARDIARRHGVSVFDSPTEIPRANFDIVICRHALEHMTQPLSVLSVIASYLRPNGRLILILPREKHYATSLGPDDHMHLYCWNFRCINNLLAIAGFEPILNTTLYNLGYRALLPLRRLIGTLGYEFATRIVGRLWRNGELVIHAKVRR